MAKDPKKSHGLHVYVHGPKIDYFW